MNLGRAVRLAACVLAAAALVSFYRANRQRAREWFGARSGAVTAPLPLGSEIEQEQRNRRTRQVVAEYGRIKALLSKAKGRGFDSGELEALAAHALELAKNGRFEESLTLLNRIEMSVPLWASR